jgi:two-component system, cell cycle sensor histidine kinase and response regulator CckA
VDLDEAYVQQHFGAKPGRYVMLAVNDTGIGIDAATMTHIFEPFFTTKEVGKGTGLGLSTVYGIVKQSDGYIWVYSELGKGATFKVYLPQVNATAEVAQREPAQTSTSQGKETILLVEDDPQVRELTHDVLIARGYTVLSAEQPNRALAICDEYKGPIHLLLTDVVMPGLSGSELALQIVKRKPDIAVLFMSGYTDNAVANHEILEHGIHFLQKPFTPSTLTQKLREILDSAAS